DRPAGAHPLRHRQIPPAVRRVESLAPARAPGDRIPACVAGLSGRRRARRNGDLAVPRLRGARRARADGPADPQPERPRAVPPPARQGSVGTPGPPTNSAGVGSPERDTITSKTRSSVLSRGK